MPMVMVSARHYLLYWNRPSKMSSVTDEHGVFQRMAFVNFPIESSLK